MLLVPLQKTLRIFCFQKTLWLDNLLPGAPVRVVALKYFWKIMYDWILGQALPLYTASSLSFSSDLVRGAHARASVRGEKRGRQPAYPVSGLQSRAWSFACLERFVRRTKKKERLLVVYCSLNQCENFRRLGLLSRIRRFYLMLEVS